MFFDAVRLCPTLLGLCSRVLTIFKGLGEGVKTANCLAHFCWYRSALSDGYIHQFLFCFRYFLKAEDLFTFITQKFISARR